jgi:hypothetical protein
MVLIYPAMQSKASAQNRRICPFRLPVIVGVASKKPDIVRCPAFKTGSWSRIRTCDQSVNSRLLYR